MYGKYNAGDHRLLGTVDAEDYDEAWDAACEKFNTGIPESGLPQGLVLQRDYESE